MGMLVRMDLVRIVIMETEDQQVIVLRERDGDRAFPIMIGTYEALAIDPSRAKRRYTLARRAAKSRVHPSEARQFFGAS